MKKHLMIALLSCIGLTSLAAPWDIKGPPKGKIAVWDKPLHPFTLPDVVYLDAYHELGVGLKLNVVVDVSQVNPSYGNLKAVFQVRIYTRTILNTWQWGWHQFTVPMPYGSLVNGWSETFNTNSLWQYEGDVYPNGDTRLYDDQFYLSYYGPA